MTFRNLFYCFVAVFLWSAAPAAAQNLFGLCDRADAQCRSLAVEVQKVRLSSALAVGRPAVDPGALLCPQDNPNCCPPEMMPVCMAHADVVVDHAVSTTVRAAIKKGCPWSKAVCDSFGSFYCELDQSWNPWSGCQDPIVVVEPEPPTWPCPDGHRPGGKPGICEPIPCFHPTLNFEMPCGPDLEGISIALLSGTDGSMSELTGPTGNLARLMATDEVRSEARRALERQFGSELRRIRDQLGAIVE